MKIEIAKHERMAESGSSLLRLIQNTNTSRLDLLVRESLQNCLDAGDKVSDYVGVNFRVGEFDAEDLNKYFDGIADKLNYRYKGKNKFIAIRDFNTSGLTGPLHFTEVKDNKFGNLLKLVYEISKAQESQGSGGSWGLGKTVYFRLGVGLVIYYTRIKKADGQYESRLAAALVEDERKPDTLIPKRDGELERGIAWWGAEYGENSTIPVTDENEIEQILGSMGIKKYAKDKTGTTIIIPYIDEDELLKETFPHDNNFSDIPYWSKSGISDYLKIAVQRWYAPRLENKLYDGQYLHCTVNGNVIDYEAMAPVFQLIQTLYNAEQRKDNLFDDKKIICRPIELRNIFKSSSCAGYVSYVKVDSADMKMDNPHNLRNPYYYIGKFGCNEVVNDPIILYSRKPGMVVSYELTGDWCDGIPKSSKSEFVIGVFKANSGNVIKQNGTLLEEYLRQSEKADHMSWYDSSNSSFQPKIVTKVQQHIRKKITADFGEITRGPADHKNLGLGKRLADLFLPPDDYTPWDEANGGQRGPGGVGGAETGNPPTEVPPAKKSKKPILRAVGAPDFVGDEVLQKVQICFGKKDFLRIATMVATENNTIKSNNWESESYLDKSFPIQVVSMELERIYIAGKPKTSQKLAGSVMLKNDKCAGGLEFNFIKTKTYGVQYGLEIKAPDDSGYVVEGVIAYKLDNVRGALFLEND